MSGITIDNPISLEIAIASQRVIPGDTLLLRGGTYSGIYDSLLNGTEAAPITIKSYPGETAIISGRFSLHGSYVLLDNLNFTYNDWITRSTELTGSAPEDMPTDAALDIFAPYSEVRHCVVYDVADFGIWATAKACKIYGNVVFNIGWDAPDRGHGHLFYTQNDGAYGRMVFKHNIATASFATGLKIYTEGAKARGYDVIGNTIFISGELFDGDDYSMNFWVQDPAGKDYKFERNHSFHDKATGDPVRMGLYNPITNLELIDNYFPEGIVHDEDNEIVTDSGGYYGTVVGNQVFVEADDYDAGRAIITIYNQAAADSVAVDVSAVLDASADYKLTQAQDYFTDIATGTVALDGTITVDMRAISHTVAAPQGWTAPATTFPTFGCFVVEKA